MSADPIRYDILVQDALRGMVRDLLAGAAKRGLPGDHHFFVTFDTEAEGVRLSERLRQQYPEEMTVVLQYQFRDLKVTDTAFEVVLSFGGVPERLHIPFAAIKGFADPSVQFALQFEALTLSAEPSDAEADERAPEPVEGPAKEAAKPPPAKSRTSVPTHPLANPPVADAPAKQTAPPGGKPGADVVRLDRFRKK